MSKLPLVSFGIVNCNRLHYLKTCVESILETTQDYTNKEMMIVDNASVEAGTEEYLKEKETQGFKIFRQKERDPSNEFAAALNILCEEFSGDYLIPLQGDQQFVVKGGWLSEYVKFNSQYLDNVGCITLDAQRSITVKNNKYLQPVGDQYKFVLAQNKVPIMGAGDVFMSKKMVELIYPFKSKGNISHEYSGDSETDMIIKIDKLIKERKLQIGCFDPIVPPAITIYNEDGTQARVRENKRYGKYWIPKEENKYYQYMEYEECLELNKEPEIILPYSIEYLANPIGWNPLINDNNWVKSPIRPETAKRDEYEEL